MPDSPVVADRTQEQRQPPGRHTLKLLLVPIFALIIVANVGDALAPRLVDTHPLQLLAMNARNRNAILVTNSLDPFSYYVVGTLRLLLSDPLFFLIGYWYGDTALRWMEKRTKTFGQSMRQMEGWFDKAAYPLVFLMPNNVICLFAGAAGMSAPAFFAVNTSGTLVRLYLIRRLGEAFEAPIDSVLEFIKDYRTPLLILSITVFTVMTVNELRRSSRDIDELADAIEGDGDDPTDTGPPAT